MKTKLTKPESFFGFEMGADKKIARWDRIVAYFNLLAGQSDRIKVFNLGSSTEGHPVILAAISDAENLINLDRLKEINSQLDDPRGLGQNQISDLAKEGKATILQSGSIHSEELGGTQMMPELAYDLITRTDEEAEIIRRNVLTLLFVCLNPDGNLMMCDWYEKWLGTEYEGHRLPWLYHKYCGHDNNRDAFMQNMAETQYLSKVLYQEWHPQVFQDHHHMGFYSPRFLCVPFTEPVQTLLDPLIMREQAWYGAHMAYKLEEKGKTGVINGAMFSGYSPAGHATLSPLLNITGCFTENANTLLASPIFVHPSQIEGGPNPRKGFAVRGGQAQVNYPHPWPGGWWHLRDVVEQMEIAVWAMLEMAARNKETVLRNRALKALRQSERGSQEKAGAFLVLPRQQDPLTVLKLLRRLLSLGIEVKRAREKFTDDGVTYPAGSYLISYSQPKMAAVRALLGRNLFPDNEWTRQEDGTPLQMDDAANSLDEFMGASIKRLDLPATDNFEVVNEITTPAFNIQERSRIGYLLDGRLNDSYYLVNQLLAQCGRVWRSDKALDIAGEKWPAGSFVLQPGKERATEKFMREWGLKIIPMTNRLPDLREVKSLRVAVCQGYWGGNEAEGWTRWVLEQFNFPYRTLAYSEVKNGRLNDQFDVIILPSEAPALISGDEKAMDKWFENTGKRFGILNSDYFPLQYRSGLGKAGTEALKSYVQEGGILLASKEACLYVLDNFSLPVKNTVKELSRREYFCPGSTLNLNLDIQNPLAFGMLAECPVLVGSASPVFSLEPSNSGERVDVIAGYPSGPDPDKSLLQSGLLIGEKLLYGKAAMVSVKQGRGKIVLSSFDALSRGWTHGTFKLVFNVLLAPVS